MFNGPWESCMLVRGLSPSECASWVQAWGSIAAILIAVAVAWWQWFSAKLKEAMREKALAFCKMEMVYELAREAVALINTMPGRGCASEEANAFAKIFSKARFRETSGALQSLGPIDFVEAKSLVAVRKLIALLEQVEALSAANLHLFKTADGPEGRWRSIAEECQPVQASANECLRTIEHCRDRYAPGTPANSR